MLDEQLSLELQALTSAKVGLSEVLAVTKH